MSEATPEATESGELEPDLVETPFYNAHEGSHGRLPGPYLDQKESHDAETIRAVSEGREPDYDNPGTTAGTPLVTEDALADNSINKREVFDPENDVAVAPVQTLPVDQAGNEPSPPAESVLTDEDIAAAVANQTPDGGTGVVTSNGTLTPPSTLADEPVVDADDEDESVPSSGA